jgi:outer membrane receptor protein involved in Fe transport
VLRVQAVWRHRYSATAEHDMTLTAGTFGFGFELGPELFQDIRTMEVLGRAEWRIDVAPALRLIAGTDVMLQIGDVSYHGPRIQQVEGNPDVFDEELGDMPTTTFDETVTFFRPALYLEATLRPLPRLELTAGVRADFYSELEEGTVDPRLSAKLRVGAATTLKAAVGRFSQPPDYGEQLEGLGNPDLGPEHAIHASVGVEQGIGPRASVGVELYAKALSNVIAAADDGMLVNAGDGRIFGAEVAGRLYPGGKLSGFLAYSLSRSERRDAPGGEWRLFDFDQTHVLTASLSWKMGRGWSLGGTGRLISGNLETPVVGSVYDANRDRYRPMYGETNSDRAPLYKQLDLRVEKLWRVGRGHIALYLDLQNATNSKNEEAVIYSYDYREKGSIYGLPIRPALWVRGDL